jgi:hypothetical protein
MACCFPRYSDLKAGADSSLRTRRELFQEAQGDLFHWIHKQDTEIQVGINGTSKGGIGV